MLTRITSDVAPRGLPPLSETLPKAIENLIRQVQPEKIILFGSYAYGNPTPDSDVDLLVVWDTDKPRRERLVTVSLALYPRLFPVDLLVKTPQELEAELPHNFFLREIVTKGIVLYERG
ncbi:MAG: nucleotidyltransferase domain-containing protein [Anaerolineales bacterium]